MLELRNVTKRFSGIPAVDDVSFQARAGEITGYLGPNGSGKSTTMKMITGLIETTHGEIFFDGRPIRGDLLGFKQRMGYVPEEPHLYSHLSGLEFLTMVGQLRDLPAKPAADRIDGLGFRRQVPINRFIADFICFEARLVVEVDGGQHADSVRDQQRDRWFAANGFRVVRFWNNEVLSNLEGVLTVLLAKLEQRQ